MLLKSIKKEKNPKRLEVINPQMMTNLVSLVLPGNQVVRKMRISLRKARKERARKKKIKIKTRRMKKKTKSKKRSPVLAINLLVKMLQEALLPVYTAP
jgi:hypothetical protein